MSIINKIKKLNLSSDTQVTLNYEEACDVFVHNETAIDTALSDTDVISTLAELITEHPKLNVFTTYGSDTSGILNHLRTEGFLDDYQRGDFEFTDYVSEVLTENFYDQDFVDSSVRAYDYKRGECTLSTQVLTTVGEILSEEYISLSPWTVSVPTENGTLTFN
jgi:hypothetical protein|tara:strand:+ start:6303 stop:6791 length:489 start_codon:yes stop_codon:yes gene_type:complete